MLAFSLHMLRAFGFEDFRLYLATRPEKSVGDESGGKRPLPPCRPRSRRPASPTKWTKAAGPFYGPKIDIKINDALGREWQCSTIQFDFNLPERFGMTYTAQDGTDQQPI